MFDQLRIDLEIKKAARKAKKQLPEICEEAYQRIWFDRSNPEAPDLTEEQISKIKEAEDKVIKKYNIDVDEIDDFYHGYWSGILALSRYVLGEGLDSDLDDLRTGKGLLDT